ncbi:PiggyBac transposable element derived 4 [Plakobranchus ocellatus]|uniref:PiggyBac transposable element derived 4 n=1 Tax=Plakobranchus ocellatus TaxID=259542 RepID=A0AAV4CPQ6_9GAST|nr:PiggyBac transposable element derived 4 [Plakobranchus ocellatus]
MSEESKSNFSDNGSSSEESFDSDSEDLDEDTEVTDDEDDQPFGGGIWTAIVGKDPGPPDIPFIGVPGADHPDHKIYGIKAIVHHFNKIALDTFHPDQTLSIDESMIRYKETFSEIVGPVHDLPVKSEPLDYFQLFFPDSLLQTFVEETNRYTEQQQAAKGTTDSYWKPATLTDIRKYIYTLITFSHHQVPELSLFWSNDPYWRVSVIADVWVRQHFSPRRLGTPVWAK